MTAITRHGTAKAANGSVIESMPFRRDGERSMLPLMYSRTGKAEQAAGKTEFGNAGESDDSRAKRVMVIDDDRRLLAVVKVWFERAGYEPSVFGSAREALEVVDDFQPDLILLDMQMPGMNGLAFLKRILDWDDKPRYPVLVMTARAELRPFFTDLDVEGFLEKPCRRERLLSMVSIALAASGSHAAA